MDSPRVLVVDVDGSNLRLLVDGGRVPTWSPDGKRIAYSANRLELFAPLKTELTYGYWIVIGVPTAVLLVIAQIILWVAWRGRRRRRVS